MGRQRVKSVQRAIAVLRAFDRGETALSVQEISRRARIPLTSTYRFVDQLASERFLEAEGASGRFRLGPEILRLGLAARGGLDLRRIALPILERLAKTSGESVSLGVRSGDGAICVLAVESEHPVRLAVKAGEVLPLYAGTSGRVLLAFADRAEQERILRSTRLGRLASRTPTSRRWIRERLRLVRARGHEVTESEIHEGARGISAPVFDASGKAIAALTLSGVTFRMSDARVRELIPLVVQAAKELSERVANSLGAAPVGGS